MNQILFSNQNNSAGEKKNTTRITPNRTNKAEITKVIKVFCIIIIIFGLTLIGEASYGIINSKPKEKDSPQVTMNRMGSKVSVSINTEKPIKDFSYRWNEGESTTIQGNGTVSILQTISIPNGNNILKITVTDYYNNKTHYQNQYIKESTDNTEPTIELSKSGTKLKVVAKDETEISYMTYSWNDGEATRIDAEKGKTEIDAELDVQKGQNKLTIIAVDSEENESTRTETIIGSNKPIFTIRTENSNLIIEAKDDDGISKISVTIDGTTTDSGDTPINQKSLTAKMPLTTGTHTIKVIVTNINGLSDTKEITANI